MKTIRILKPLWNLKHGTLYRVDEFRANFAIRKGYAELVEEEKAEPADYKNKAEKKPKKNK